MVPPPQTESGKLQAAHRLRPLEPLWAVKEKPPSTRLEAGLPSLDFFSDFGLFFRILIF